ncbi:MAG TPA: PQQ-binding-like beta-propeller repeat protein [Candidatus Aquilonibacter sp.]|nr:PQQ-binding-like beta-propeller repeat protein [Candidatus Aquilonibacter sp.]
MRVSALIAVALLVAVSACSNNGSSQPSPSPSGTGQTDPNNWPSYNRDLDSTRFSPLSDITPATAPKLKKTCSVPLTEVGALQASPLAIDGKLYVTTARDTYAIDGTNCRMLWTNTYSPKGPQPFPVDRGLAWDGGTRLVRGEPDGHLIAIDLNTGKTLWDVAPASGAKGEFLSSAPIFYDGTIFIGTAGSDWGVKGRMMAFDVTNGKQKWTFTTIASGNDPNAKSWGSVRAADTGGGGMWTSYSLDPQTDELYVSVGNPAPDFASSYRPGANLYTDSEVVLDPATGRMKWYYQALPHDVHDWDLATAAALATTSDGKSIAAVASKDGNLYGIDRTSHKLLWHTPEVRMLNTTKPATIAGTRICPGVLGGSEWNGAAWDAKNQHFITPMDDWCATLKLGTTRYIPGQFFFGGSYVGEPFSAARGTLTATDANGKIVWQYKAHAPMLAGVTPTAGGVTLTGDMSGNFLVFDSANGKLLFKDHTQGSIAGGVITYGASGRQYVALTSGNISRLTWGAQGKPSIFIYSL